MRNSDEYTATLLAAGPGIAGCALLAACEFRPGLPALILAYPLALLAFLPGLPLFGWCLASAWPRYSAPLPAHRRALSGLLSLFAPVWHCLLWDASFRLYDGSTPVDWLLVARYTACLWLVTVAGWLLVIRTPPA